MPLLREVLAVCVNRPVLKDTIPLGVSPEADRGEPPPAAQRKLRGCQAVVLLICATPGGLVFREEADGFWGQFLIKSLCVTAWKDRAGTAVTRGGISAGARGRGGRRRPKRLSPAARARAEGTQGPGPSVLALRGWG